MSSIYRRRFFKEINGIMIYSQLQFFILLHEKDLILSLCNLFKKFFSNFVYN